MPTWLAIAIPSVVAVAAVLMWILDYSKKAHEIEKVRLELKKLGDELRRRDGGLYIPTPQEVDDIAREAREERKRREEDGGWGASDLMWPLLGATFVVYAVIRLLVDVVRLLLWIF